MMNAAQLKAEIEKFAQEMNLNFVEACQAMQGAAAQLGNEEMIMAIHQIKMGYIQKNNL
jgi:hypothetical protein